MHPTGSHDVDFTSGGPKGRFPTRAFVIRAASPTDAGALDGLLLASYSELLAPRYDRALLDRALPHLTHANPALLACGTYYVAEAGKPVGCGGWTAAKPESGEIAEGEAHVRHFATHPGWVRQGVGTALLARCLADAALLGVRRMHCCSTLNAEPFYRASGFDAVATVEVALGPGLKFPGVLMRREVA